MEFFSQTFYFILIISVLVLVHELGHFSAAKLFRMRVDRFSIGLGPRAFGKKIGETDYCISWIPFGGFVKIVGMIDESFDNETMRSEPQPWEFRSKPLYQRFIVITAGVFMNVVLAVMIFWGLNLARGRDVHPVTTIGYVQPGSLAERSGLRDGDRILSVNGEQARYWENVENAIVLESGAEGARITVDRGGEQSVITVPGTDIEALGDKRFGIYAPGSRPRINAVEDGLPASKSGIQPGDALLSINNQAVRTSEDVIAILGAFPGKPVSATWLRKDDTLRGSVTPNEKGKIGIALFSAIEGPKEELRYGVFEAFTASVKGFWTITSMTVTNIWDIIIGKASFRQSIGGPVKIARMAAQQAEVGIASFLSLVAILSISLAVINIFPFPALDGGYVIFLMYELIFRREIPQKVQYYLLYAGWLLLIGLMVFVLYNDIFH